MSTRPHLLTLTLALALCGCPDPADSDTETPSGDTDTEVDGGSDTDVGSDSESCGEEQFVQVCNPADPTATYWEDECGNLGDVADSCPGIWLCIDGEDGADAECGCADIESEGRCYNEQPGLYYQSHIAPENVCGSVNTDPEDALEICGAGTRCETLFDGPPACERSLTEAAADSPYYDNGCGVFTPYLETKTSLDADCRCRNLGDGGDPNNVFGDGDVVDPFGGLRPNGKIPNCMNGGRWPTERWPLDYGSGQNFRAFAEETAFAGQHLGGAWLPDSRELVALMQWTRPEFGTTATVVAYQVDTGARRIISGIYPDPDPTHITQPGWVPYDEFLADRAEELGPEAAYTIPDDPDNALIDIDFAHWGSGHVSQSRITVQPHLQPLSGASSIRLGADGMLYAAGYNTGQGSFKAYEVVRIHPETGHRELAWKSQFYASDAYQSGVISDEFGQCFRHNSTTDSSGYPQSVAVTNYSLSVADDSSMYLTFDDATMGSGVMRISADGSTCEFVSRFGTEESGGILPPEIGGGYTPGSADYFYGTLIHDGKLFAVRGFQNELVSFDLQTGFRTRESAEQGTGYNGIGYTNMWYDEGTDLIYTVGNIQRNAGAVFQLGTGLRQSLYADGAGAPLRAHSAYEEDRDLNTGFFGYGNGVFRGAAFIDPDNPDLMYVTIEPAAFGVMEFSTYNGMILSWDSQSPVTPMFP